MSVCLHSGTLHWTPPFAKRLSFHRLYILLCSAPLFHWQTTSFHAYCFLAFILLKAILLICGSPVRLELGEGNKTLPFDLFRLYFACLFVSLFAFVLLLLLLKWRMKNRGKGHNVMLSRIACMCDHVKRNQSWSFDFACSWKQWPWFYVYLHLKRLNFRKHRCDPNIRHSIFHSFFFSF